MATGTKNPDVADINLDSNLQVQDQDFSALDSVESEVVGRIDSNMKLHMNIAAIKQSQICT